MENKELRKFQQRLLEPTLEEALNYGHTLDYTVNSLAKIDDILTKLHLQYSTDVDREKQENSEGYSGLAMCYAAYIIEVIERVNGKGELRKPSINTEEDYVFELYVDKKIIFPYNWVIKKIIDGGDDNIVKTYNMIEFNKKSKSIFSSFFK